MILRELPLGFVLLGLPLEKSENGYIVVESGRIRVRVNVTECGERRVLVNAPESTVGAIERFIGTLLRELGLMLCVDANVEQVSGAATGASVYASVTTAAFLAVAEFHGERPTTDEVLEYAGMIDDVEGPWANVITALRFNAMRGGVTVYRNLDEYFQLSETARASLRIIGSSRVNQQLYTEESLGPDLYGSLIHTVGILVLEGSVRVRDNSGTIEPSVFRPLLSLQRSLASYFWGYNAEGYPSPGFPGEFYQFSLG